jgi:hypothetical protein
VDKSDWAPSTPGVVYNQTVTNHVSGIEPNASANIGTYGATIGNVGNTVTGFYPGSGVGVLANVRADYTLNPNVILTGQVGVLTQPITLSSDSQEEFTTTTNLQQTVGGLLYQTNTNNDSQHQYSGTVNNGQTYAKVRSQFLAKGWKLGLGVNLTNSWYVSDITDKQTTNNVTTLSGTGSPATDYTETVSSGVTMENKLEATDTTVELPIGVVFNLLENLPLRLGVVHVIDYSVVNNSQQVTSRTPQTDQKTYTNGSTATTVTGNNGQEEINTSSYSISQDNVFTYGMSWWPYPTVQVDFTGFASNVLALNRYNLSMSFYF